jgi:hypothetical protein
MDIIDKILKEFTNKRGGINTKKINMSTNVEYLNALIDATHFLPENTNLRFRFNYIKEGFINKPKKCKTCDSKILTNVYQEYCSVKCSNNNPEVVEKIKNTWSSKNNNDIEIIQTKRRKTNIVKYGVDIASKLPEVIEKNKNSHVKQWGDFAMRNNEIVEKRKVTCEIRYGGVGMASKEIFNKVKKTNIEKYGVEYFSQTEIWFNKCIETAIEKYGKEWVSKVDTINSKQQSGGYSYYDFEFPSGKIVRVQGYEPKVLTKLVVDYDENDIVVGVQNIIDHIGFFHYVYENQTHRYYPDIYIKSENQVIEVKSNYTFNKEKDKNLLKRQSVLDKGINFKFIIL